MNVLCYIYSGVLQWWFSVHAVGDIVVDIQLMVLGDTYEFACLCAACVQTKHLYYHSEPNVFWFILMLKHLIRMNVCKYIVCFSV